MKVRYIVTLVMCCLIGFSAMAQKGAPIEFDTENLMTQMLEYLNKATSEDSREKQNKALVKIVEPLYSAMDETDQQTLVDIMDMTQKKKMRQLPDVYNIIETMVPYATEGNNLKSWLSCITYLLENKSSKSVGEFVEFSSGLAKDRILNKVKSNLWQAQAGSAFELRLDGDDITVIFDKPMELYYSSGQDNGTIYGTHGEFDYFSKQWTGHEGRLNWDRTGLPTTACWATLKNYEANTKLPKFVADSVMFTNTQYFQQPIMGYLEESLSRSMDPDKYVFPKFRSYQTDFELKEILKGVDYRGSFMMNGAKFVTANEKYPATMVFHRADKVFATVESNKVSVMNNKLTANNASIKLFIDEDSIYNNGVTVRYVAGEHKLICVNKSDRNYYSPYVNTYHNLDMFCESLVWDMDKDKIEIASMSADGRSGNVTFESANYYSAIKYRNIQGVDQVSPVMRMYKFVRDENGGDMIVNINEFARYIRMDLLQAKSMIHVLAKAGLVSYLEKSGIVYVQDKLIDYVKAYNKSKDHDYDAISLYSNKVKLNAELDLASNNMHIYGVDSLFVSDSQQVVVYPKRRELIMEKNRKMRFDGAIHCGRFDFAVENASFDYDKYIFDMPNIKMMIFSVQRFNNANKLEGVRSVLRDMVGSLAIDKPNNHSGLVKNKEYPMFKSEEDCFVYYDYDKLFGGAYVRDKFYYRIDPFVLTSLKDFKTDSLQFEGTLVSAGIFPDIREPLTIQKDYSLGFDMDTPPDGYPAYGGKGKYVQHLNLSNQGLRAGGNVEYLTSLSKSKDIVFLPDSMLAITDTFIVREEGGFPDIRNGKTKQRWYPYRDSMNVDQIMPKGNQFKMYHDDALLAGGVTLKPEGALAHGTATIHEGELASNRFELKTMEMFANVSSFVLHSDLHHEIAYRAENMKSHVDYTNRFTELQANTDLQRTELPLVAYAAYIDKARWEIDDKLLSLMNSKSEETGGLEGMNICERVQHKDQPGALFVCTADKADSLQYNSTLSIYDYNKGQLSSRNVFVLNVADAAIAPVADTLHIGVGGAMMPLHKSQVLASRDSAFHLFYDAELVVKNKRTYGGKAIIDYVDEEEKVQKIYINDMAPNQAGITIANGFIPDSANFTLNRALGFAGNVRVEGNKKFYYFDGGVRLLHSCAPTEKLGLLAYSNYLDPLNIQISVPEIPTDWKGNRITASILADKSTMTPKPAFLTKEQTADNEMLSSFGLLMYDKDASTYTIASAEKHEDFEGVIDRYLQLNTETCMVEGEGPAKLGYREGMTSLFAYAKGQAGAKTEDFELSGVFGFNFPIATNVTEAIAQQIADDLRLSPADADNEMLRRAMIYTQGEENGESNYSTYVSTGLYETLPKEIESTFLFEKLEWHYAPGVGYYATGMTSLGAVGKKELHLSVRVTANISKMAAGHVVTLYVQVARDHWYYFSYNTTNQLLTICSSVGTVEDMIKAIPADGRQIHDKETGRMFQYKVGNAIEVTRFQNRMSRTMGEELESEDEE